MNGKQFFLAGDVGYGPVPLSYFSVKNGFNDKDRQEITKLDIGERYDLDTCSKCGRGKGERMVMRVM